MYDIVIIGGGPAGMTAALYALRENKKVLILEKEAFGGQIATSPRLENYPSIKAISGYEFANNLFEQILDLGAEFELEDVESITKEESSFKVTSNYHTYEAKKVIIATGVEHKKFGYANEEKLTGHGISYCATCDGPFYKDKNVIVIGDANSALQYALLLSQYCKSVHICTLFDKWFADDFLIKKIGETKNITFEHNLSLLSYNGNDKLDSLTFENTIDKNQKTIECDGCFVAIGQIPKNDKFANLVNLENGFIVTDSNMETRTKGLYAIGDCRVKDVRQVVTALNDGAIAAVHIIKNI